MVPTRQDTRRRLCAALGIAVALLTFPIGKAQGEAAKHQDQRQGYQKGAMELPSPPAPSTPPLVIKVEPTAEEIHCAAKQEAAERKILGLQPEMWVVLFNALLVVGTGFLWWATKDNAIAAKRAAGVAERALTDLETPFIYPVIKSESIVGLFKPMRRYGADASAISPEVSFTLKNYGRTPALLGRAVAILEHWTGPPADLRDVHALDATGAVLAPGEETGGEPFQVRSRTPIDATAFQSIKDNAGRLFLVGEVRFSDIFGQEWIQDFCLAWNYDAERFVPWGALHNGRHKLKQ